MTTLSLTIPDEDWIPVYEPAEDETNVKADARSQLNATVAINGTPFHLDAYEVEHVLDQVAVTNDLDLRLGEFHSAAGANGAFETITIAGREYVVIATPHC